jgi:hypothetical protein
LYHTRCLISASAVAAGRSLLGLGLFLQLRYQLLEVLPAAERVEVRLLVLKREQSEEEMAVDGGGHGVDPPGDTQRAGGAGNLVGWPWENPVAFPAARAFEEETPWRSIR